MTPTITKEQRDDIVRRDGLLCAWLDEHKRRSYRPAEVEHLNPSTNEERGLAQVYDFVHNPPAKYFAYTNREVTKVTTWGGNLLGTVSHRGKVWRSNFGDRRQAFRSDAINGCTYAGVAFLDAGDYVRLRKLKG